MYWLAPKSFLLCGNINSEPEWVLTSPDLDLAAAKIS